MISFIVPTVGRPSLQATLRSIETYPGDEILIVGENIASVSVSSKKNIRLIECPRGNDWGHSERNFATPMARGQYIAHIDDDDVYAPGSRAAMQDAITKNPGKPVLFRMQYPCGISLWAEKRIFCGNVGTPMFLIPNMPTRLGVWKPFVGGDCAFLEACKWSPEEFVWRDEVVALLGHNT
jgi:hypothetical protein